MLADKTAKVTSVRKPENSLSFTQRFSFDTPLTERGGLICLRASFVMKTKDFLFRTLSANHPNRSSLYKTRLCFEYDKFPDARWYWPDDLQEKWLMRPILIHCWLNMPKCVREGNKSQSLAFSILLAPYLLDLWQMILIGISCLYHFQDLGKCFEMFCFGSKRENRKIRRSMALRMISIAFLALCLWCLSFDLIIERKHERYTFYYATTVLGSTTTASKKLPLGKEILVHDNVQESDILCSLISRVVWER